MKRNLWAFGLAFLSFFFCMPVAAAMGIGTISQQYARWLVNGTGRDLMTPDALRYERLLNLVQSTLGLENIVTALVIGGAAIVLGLTGFMYLHSKKQVDFYQSLPVKRELLFCVKYLDSFLVILSMYLLNLLFAIGVFAVGGVPVSIFIGGSLITMLIHMTGFLMIYGVMVLAVLLTGNFFISILGAGVLYGYVPAAAVLMQGLMYLFFVTVDGREMPFKKIMLNGSPISYYGSIIGKGFEQRMISYAEYLSAGETALSLQRASGYGNLLGKTGAGLAAALILFQ